MRGCVVYQSGDHTVDGVAFDARWFCDCVIHGLAPRCEKQLSRDLIYQSIGINTFDVVSYLRSFDRALAPTHWARYAAPFGAAAINKLDEVM